MSRMKWTPEAIKTLTDMVADGHSVRAISNEMKWSRQSIYENLQLAGVTPAKVPAKRLRRPPVIASTRKKPPADDLIMVRTSNTCSEIECYRQRADGYALCFKHLPPLNLKRAAE